MLSAPTANVRHRSGERVRTSSSHAIPTTSGNSAKLPWTLPQSAVKTGTSHMRHGWAARPATIHSVSANSGSASSCGRIASAGEATTNPPSVSREAVRGLAPLARHARYTGKNVQATRTDCSAASVAHPP